METFNQLYQNLFFRSLDIARRRNTIQRLKFLRKSQYWERKTLYTWQLNRLNTLLEVAKQYSPFYKERLHNIELPLKNLEELQRLPVITKSDIRNNLNEILCTNANKNKIELSKTGGSTGEPSFYYLDWNSKDWNRGCVYRSSEWADTYLGDKTIQMMGSHFDLNEFKKLKWKIVFFLQRYKDLPVAVVNDEIYEKYYQIIHRYKPTNIWGYASGIYLFSKFIETNYPNADFNYLKAIITSSETLYPEWREVINRVFKGKKVFDHYGSREVYIASECKEHSGYHIHSEVIILEIADQDGKKVPDGHMGRILITDLSNLSFPFIRYEIGDIGTMSSETRCPCGIRLPKLKSMEGRIADIVTLKDRKLTPPNFTLLMSDFEGIAQYQIIQNKIDDLTVKIVINSKFNQATEKYIKRGLRKLVGSDVHIRIEHVDNIEIPKSGKRRYIISKLEM